MVRRKDTGTFEENLMERKEKNAAFTPPGRQSFLPAQRCPRPRLTGHFPLRVWQSILAQKPTCSATSWRLPSANASSQQLAFLPPSANHGL